MPNMVNTGLTAPPPSVRCRRIEDADAEKVVALLARGFGRRRPYRFWMRVIQHLASRAAPSEVPRYGYLLESNRAPVGAILQIFARIRSGNDGVREKVTTRCNVSSWYVEPEFRSYAPLLVSQALKRKDVTYLNISSAPHTRPIAEAQGYERFSNGVFVAIPLLSRASEDGGRIVAGSAAPQASFEVRDQDLIDEHARFGCLSLWCETPGQAYPFVFRRRLVKGVLPCAQLIYSREVEDFVRFARPLGAFLARRGCPFVLVDANGPIRGLAGKYFDDTMPKYFKGPERPRLGDLAYTEAALFGM
jgi:hypothetical protein